MTVRMEAKVQVVQDNEKALLKALAQLANVDVLVGVPESNKSKGRKPKVSNALLAYVHNNGSPANNIPARPTIEPGIIDAKDQEVKYLGQAADAAMDGDTEKMTRALEACGQVAVNAVKRRIRSNTPPPLKGSTIKARKRRGNNRTNTLVDTGSYLNAHTYVVRKG